MNGSLKITEINVWREDLELRRPYTIAGETIEASENMFVTVALEDGTVGLGSASPSERVCNESMSDCEEALERGADILRNADLRHFVAWRREISHQLKKTPAACAAMDIALFDAYCKWQGIRVVDYLGAQIKALPTSVTIGIKDLDGVRDDLAEYLGCGFTCIKVKIGSDVGHDVEVIRKMREWEGAGFRIRVDANQGYSALDLQRFIWETENCEVELIEQPLMAPALDRMRALDPDIRGYCMADEDLKTQEQALDLVKYPLPYGMWNIKLMKSGGISGGKYLADIASLREIPLMWGCMDESRVSISAALHVAYASANTQYLDLDGSFDLAKDVVSGGFEVKNGMMYLTNEPGLGVKRV